MGTLCVHGSTACADTRAYTLADARAHTLADARAILCSISRTFERAIAPEIAQRGHSAIERVCVLRWHQRRRRGRVLPALECLS